MHYVRCVLVCAACVCRVRLQQLNNPMDFRRKLRRRCGVRLRCNTYEVAEGQKVAARVGVVHRGCFGSLLGSGGTRVHDGVKPVADDPVSRASACCSPGLERVEADGKQMEMEVVRMLSMVTE